MTLACKNLGTPDQKRSFTHGDMHIVTLAGATFVRATFGPGWRWSTDARPDAGTDSWQVAHSSYVISGRFAVRMEDGTQAESRPGDAAVVGPGNDAWVVGGEPCVVIDIVPGGSGAAGATEARLATWHPCGIEFRAALERLSGRHSTMRRGLASALAAGPGRGGKPNDTPANVAASACHSDARRSMA